MSNAERLLLSYWRWLGFVIFENKVATIVGIYYSNKCSLQSFGNKANTLITFCPLYPKNKYLSYVNYQQYFYSLQSESTNVLYKFKGYFVS